MKTKIHPKYIKDATIKCVCGATFKAGSTQEVIETEICSHCHPFYTGKANLVDTAGRVAKFKLKAEKAKKIQEAKTKKIDEELDDIVEEKEEESKKEKETEEKKAA